MNPPSPASDLSEVVAANVTVHSAMAATYNEREPHYRPENQRKVRARLEAVAADTGGGRLLDLGCGTGFIVHLARDLFAEIHGVDITQAMLDRIDTSGGNITLHNQRCESLPFADGYFDAVTAYSFLDHLEDYSVVLREAHRVMRPGAVLYADLLPNKAFWDAIGGIADRHAGQSTITASVRREVEMFTSQHDMVEKDYAIPGQAFLTAEPWKSGSRGIAAADFAAVATQIGFAEVQVNLDWYLGQGQLLHGKGEESMLLVEDYLRSVEPLSDHLFKYLRVRLVR